MSPSPSPHISHSNTKKDRPPALDIIQHHAHASSDRQPRSQHPDLSVELISQQPNLHISLAQEEPSMDHDLSISRSASTTSSLDPYYFGITSPTDSPVPPLPTLIHLSSTPDQQPVQDPVTPAKDPATIDRRGLVGVGELTTPRWTRAEYYGGLETPDNADRDAEFQVLIPQVTPDDEPDSPWTIEAVDSEASENEEVSDVKIVYRPLRTRPSIADESGGEEILYPRNLNAPIPDLPPKLSSDLMHSDRQPSHVSRPLPLEPSGSDSPSSPPSAFAQPSRRAKKRTSDEFEMDQFGALVSKRVGPAKAKDEKTTVRKHRSLNVSNPSVPRDGKGKEPRWESIGLMINSNEKVLPVSAKTSDKHVRQASIGSSPTNLSDGPPQRRVQTTDFSHLPPSPSSTSIQQFLRQTTSSGTSHSTSLNPSAKDTSQTQPSNVAHSLLRGTQEGWSGLGDEATAEALRKLDGLSGKSARARASVASFGRASSSSRPGTPAGKSGGQWEGVSVSDSGKAKRGSDNIKDSGSIVKDREQRHPPSLGPEPLVDSSDVVVGNAISSDEQSWSALEKTPKKNSSTSARSSFTPKRGSTSSTTYTSTPSSRDSASMSATTSMTSVSATSGRHSIGKTRRNSAGSDISSIHSSDAASLKDRVASIAINGDAPDDGFVPPVPPLPKDLSTYPPHPTSVGLTSPVQSSEETRNSQDNSLDRNISLEVPSVLSLSQRNISDYSAVQSGSESASAVLRTPSKKWSFSSALNLKLSSSPSASGQKSGFPLSPRSINFGQQLRKSTSKDQGITLPSGGSKSLWEPEQPDAMLSAASLMSLSSTGSTRTPALAASKTPDPVGVPSRSGTGSSASTSHTTSALSAPQQGPLSPTASVRRSQSKRLTPSSIPFFRRSSSQSMHLPSSNFMTASSSPTLPPGNSSSAQTPLKPVNSTYNSTSTSVSGSAHKKSSVLSLGLPSLLKSSSSRRSLHNDAKDAAKEIQRAKDAAEKDKARAEKQKKEERSESRISVLMGGRKRGKTLSSTDPRKPKSPVNLPPMQMSALEPVTAQRVARLKPSPSTSSAVAAPSISRTGSSTSRLTSQTVSSMQKQSDGSLRTRNQLPTIAGSPSVGINGTSSSQILKDQKEPPSSLGNSVVGQPKETPTKIPRISSRTSAAASPPLKPLGSAVGTRRTSVHVGATSSANPSPTGLSTNEFGVIENGDPSTKAVPTRQTSIRSSPSTSTSRVPRQASTTISSSGSILHRKGNRDSVSFTGLRKASASSVTSISTPSAANEPSQHRFSALSPSRGLKLLTPKISLPSSRSSNSVGQNGHQTLGSPSSSRQSLSTPSPAPSSVDEEELFGDEEMLLYIRRQQAKKMAAGATQEELDDLIRFPEPFPPGSPSSPSVILKNSSHYLSEYERKEILDYPSVYWYGAKSKKIAAVLDNSTNNHGYDDERGDYLVVNKDHLAYRYEVTDTLGKGSFGQVLHCRNHCTGESVAIKIIRNKKRFHHQALVEIKILENLRKWDADEKHHVIKMTEYFYFRNHLCIAMELLSINLYELIKANGFVGFTTALIRRFTNQMLLSLSLMRHHRIVHCDLKPENVLLRHPAKSAIKVIDFGSSCFEHEKIYTYIQSRFYRSPEVILGMNYHMAIDMWSLGCILAELFTGYPIFPGENEQDQLSCIMEVLGLPEREFVNRSSRKKLFFDPNGAPRAVINSKGRRRRPGTKSLVQVLRCNDEDFVDFVSKCLIWDPERRIKPQAAMRHPFVAVGRRQKASTSVIKSTPSSSLSGSRSKQLNETPKKSLISAPTPLTARSSRTATAVGPATPNTAHTSALGSSSRSYRMSQSQGLSSYSSRTLNGFTATAAK